MEEADEKSEEIGQRGKKSGSWNHGYNLIEGSVASYPVGTCGPWLSPGWSPAPTPAHCVSLEHDITAGIAEACESRQGRLAADNAVPCTPLPAWPPLWHMTLDSGCWAALPPSLGLVGTCCYSSLCLPPNILLILSFLRHFCALRTEHWRRLSIYSHRAYTPEGR